MANTIIEQITLTTVTEKTGFLGRKTQTQELIMFTAPGGHIYLREDTLNQGGDSWQLFKARLRASAKEHSIPFEDLRK